ncbi:TonB-dependent siderophore receptor [plant metagenome]|uniref:TonB-dependent siderophore receptor n=1 Tax=plant metagenome TaxID=1297885 RepID=A0A484S551_9ZZZZ
MNAQRHPPPRTLSARPRDFHRLPASSLVLALALAVGAALPARPAWSQAAAAQVSLRAQPLADALFQLADQTGLQILFSPDLVGGRRAPALEGNYTPDDALTRLLEGSGLQYRRDGNRYILSADAGMLNPVLVTAMAERHNITEGSRSYTTGISSIASKTEQTFREIPQSVSVVTRQQIEDQNLNDIRQAMAVVPGITYNGVDFFSRGFAITSMQIDGGAPLALGSYNYDPQQQMAFYDRVEVMRGASGLLGGMGDPGGIINLVRKKPLSHDQVKVALSAGRWDDVRGEIDASGVLAENGKLRARGVLSYQHANSYIDHRGTERPAVYGVVEADVGEHTLLTLGGSYSQINNDGAPPTLPRYSNGADLALPRSANLSQPWAYDDTDRWEIFSQLEHRFGNGWVAKLNASHTEQETDRIWNYTSGSVDPATLTGLTWGAGRAASNNKQDVLDANLSGNFKLWGQVHDFVVGADWQRVRSDWVNSNLAVNYREPVDPFDPGAWNPSRTDADYNYSAHYGPWGQEQVGGYAMLRVRPTDRLSLVGGARVSRYEFSQRIQTKRGAADWALFQDAAFKESTEITPYGGILYDLDDQWTAYGSYSAIYKPQPLVMQGPQPGTALPPIKGKSFEAGVKGEVFNGAANVTFSVFNVERNGTAVLDPRYAGSSSTYEGNCCYLPQGTVVSRGFDVELGGEVARGWQVTAGYTFNTTRDKSTDAVYSSVTPKHLFKLATAYRLPGDWAKWTVGGSALLQSASYVSGTARNGSGAFVPFDFMQGGYAVLNAMVRYQVQPSWDLTLNVNNLADRVYYQQIGTLNGNNVYGTPRNAMLTLRGTF